VADKGSGRPGLSPHWVSKPVGPCPRARCARPGSYFTIRSNRADSSVSRQSTLRLYQKSVVFLQFGHLPAQSQQFGPLGRLQGLLPVDLSGGDPAPLIFDPNTQHPRVDSQFAGNFGALEMVIAERMRIRAVISIHRALLAGVLGPPVGEMGCDGFTAALTGPRRRPGCRRSGTSAPDGYPILLGAAAGRLASSIAHLPS
jgi:hypothetical protein